MGLGDSRETAAFNLALPYLMRVNNILNSNYTEFRNGNYAQFAINLRQLYRELYPWLQVDEKKEINEPKEFKEAFDKLARISKTNKIAIWKQLEEIEMMLRMKFKTLGMLMPKLTDPRFLFGNKQK